MTGKTFSEVWWKFDDGQKFRFIEENYPLRTSDGQIIENWKFTEWQKDWWRAGPCFIQDKSQLINRILLKCRDAGATQIFEALESLIGVQIYTRTFVPIAAGIEKQSMLPIRYVKKFIEDCKYTIKLKKPLHLQAESYIEFEQGARIESFPGGNPEGLHGPRALWGYLDELARAQYQKELISAFDYFFAEGGQLSIISTAYGKNNEYWKILQHFKEFNYKRFDVLIFKDMEKFDITRPLSEQMHLGFQCPWLSMDNLERKRSGDVMDNYENFRQNMCGDPLEEITQFFPDALTHNPPVLNEILTESPERKENEVWIGALDVAAKINKTVIVAGIVQTKNNLPFLSVRNIKIIDGSYPVQKVKVISDISTFKYRCFSPDETGLGGINWVSDLRQKCSNTQIKGITYGGKDWVDKNTEGNNKMEMFEKTKNMMQEGYVEIPAHTEFLAQLSRVERKIFSKHTEYSGKGDGSENDDIVCAFCQLCLLFYRMFIKNYALKAEIKGIDVYPRTSITRGINYQKRMRFL